jgi:hypothetical protein
VTAPHTQTLATVLVTLDVIKVAGVVGSLWVTVSLRRLTARAKEPITDLQEVHAFADTISPAVGTGIPGVQL